MKSYKPSATFAKSKASTRALVSALIACRRERIQRSSIVRGSGPRPPRTPGAVASSPTRVMTKRVALKSLLASAWPCWTFSSLKRTSCVEDIASRPKRTASAP